MLTLVFSGTTIEIVYLAGPHLGTLALEVDDTVLRTVITTSDQTAYHQTTTLNYLTDEPHTLRVYAQEGGVVAVDAFRAFLAEDTGGIQSSLPLPPPSAYEIAYNCDGNDICLRNPLATESPVQITNLDQFIAPEWSPDGRRILYHRDIDGTSGLGILEPDGTDRGIFAITPTAINSRKSWSGDGKKILFASLGRLYYIDVTKCPAVYQDNNTTPPPVPNCVSHSISIPLASSGFSDPNWHPDGRQFVFHYRNPTPNQGAGQDQIYTALLNISSLGTAEALDVEMVSDEALPSNDSYEHPTWSPDGSHLVVAHTHNSNEVLRMLIGTPSEPITDEMDNYPDWSPSGTQLVYVNRPTNSLYLVPALGGSPIPLGPGASPSWNRTIVCSVPSPGNANFYRAPIGFNPYEGILSFTSSYYDFELDAQFTEYVTDDQGITWYRVARILQHGTQQPPPPGDIPGNMALAVQQKGGVWIKPIAWQANGPPDCDTDGLRVAHEYDIPNIPWDSFNGFSSLPISVADICAAQRQEIHALGFPEPQEIYPERSPAFYPRDLHGGVDFFMPTTAGSGNVVSVGDGIVVGIGVGYVGQVTKFPISESHHVWGAYETNEATGPDVEDEPDEPGEYGYAVIVRYGHLYVLYGHILYLSDDIWVGSHVRPGQFMGVLGTSGERHLHIEVHNFQEYREQLGYDLLDETGILPYGGDFRSEGAPFVYDFLQLLNDQAISSTVATDNLNEVQDPLFDDQRNVSLNLSMAL